MFLPDFEVLGAMAGSGVDEARAGILGDMRAHKQRHVKIVAPAAQGMGERESCERRRRHVAETPPRRHARGVEDFLGSLVGEDQPVADLGPIVVGCLGDFVEAVFDVVGERDGAVAGDRPWRRRPDNDRGLSDLIRDEERVVARPNVQFRPGIVQHRKFHIDRRAFDRLIFDLRFGKRGAFHHRPHHRLGAAIEQPVHGEFHQLGGDRGFGVEAHGGVGMLPIAHHPEPLEFLALHVEPVLGERPALGAEGDHRLGVGQVGLRVALSAIILLLHLPLDGKAVTVPARHVVGVLAHHLLRAHNHVLQDLVQTGADMNVAVGVRRPVMQHEGLAPPRLFAQLVVETETLPTLEKLRLALGQAGLHGKVGLGQEQRLAPVASGLRLKRLRLEPGDKGPDLWSPGQARGLSRGFRFGLGRARPSDTLRRCFRLRLRRSFWLGLGVLSPNCSRLGRRLRLALRRGAGLPRRSLGLTRGLGLARSPAAGRGLGGSSAALCVLRHDPCF